MYMSMYIVSQAKYVTMTVARVWGYVKYHHPSLGYRTDIANIGHCLLALGDYPGAIAVLPLLRSMAASPTRTFWRRRRFRRPR